MKKCRNSLITVIWLLFFCQNVVSQHIEQLYINMPDVVEPVLSKDQRHELLEYYKENQVDSITNRFGTQSHMLVLDTLNQQIKVRVTENSTFDMMLFKNKSTFYIGVINTVCAPICMSNVQFYDTTWNLVPLKFKMPVSIDWLDQNKLKSIDVSKEWVENVLENNFITLAFDAANKTISSTNQSLNFLNEEDLEKVKPLMFDKPIIYRFENNEWVK